jgi:hypothetical protein
MLLLEAAEMWQTSLSKDAREGKEAIRKRANSATQEDPKTELGRIHDRDAAFRVQRPTAIIGLAFWRVKRFHRRATLHWSAAAGE